jgi:hypothetical protein
MISEQWCCRIIAKSKRGHPVRQLAQQALVSTKQYLSCFRVSFPARTRTIHEITRNARTKPVLAAQAGGQDVRAPWLLAEMFYGSLQDADAFVELIDRDEFARAMGYADVAGTENDGVGPEVDEAGRFGAEGDRPRLLA